jgi:hypothetical protein
VRPPPLRDLELLLRARERAPELERGRVVERERELGLRDRDLPLPAAGDALELEPLPDLLEPRERLLVFRPVERLLVFRPACCSAMEPSSSGHVPLWLPNFETSKPSTFEALSIGQTRPGLFTRRQTATRRNKRASATEMLSDANAEMAKRAMDAILQTAATGAS